MNIAVNAFFLPGSFPESGSHFIITSFTSIAAQFPEHQFIFITDKATLFTFPSEKNCTNIIVGPEIKNSLRLKYWLNYKVPTLLLKHHVDVFVTSAVCSLRSKIPQCLIINELSFLTQKNELAKNWNRYLKKNTADFLSAAKTIVATSVFLQQQLINIYNTKNNTPFLVYKNAPPIFHPVDWEQKENIKQQYCLGKEYFFYSGNIGSQHNLIPLLKAFSFFKKRQKSNMQLVLVSTSACDTALSKSLSLYKYKTDIQLLEYASIETIALLTSAAYAVVNPTFEEGFNIGAVEAMQSGTPLIISNIPVIQEICGDAALFINPTDFNDIADKMMLLFKDENKKKELITKGLQQSTKFSKQKSNEQLWQAVVNELK